MLALYVLLPTIILNLAPTFSKEDGAEKLIEAVRYFPCIWDDFSKSYKDISARMNAWK